MFDVDVTVNGASYGAFIKQLRGLSPEVAKELRKELSKVVRTQIVAKQRAAVQATNSQARNSGGHTARALHALSRRTLTESNVTRAVNSAVAGSGLRAAVARSLRVTQSGDAVRVVADGSRMPPGQQSLPRAMNTGKWRHPVFGGPGFVTQTTTPNDWFDRPAREATPAVVEAGQKAIESAINKIT